MHKTKSKGFTLIELLIVIAIIAIIAGVVFVALDPLKRFQDSRDARRWADVSNILSAIKVHQVDNKGYYMFPIASTTLIAAETGYMISNATTTTGCNTGCAYSTSTNACINLQALVDRGYLGSLPVNPNGVGTWSSIYTGYVLTRTAAGAIRIQSCEAENAANNPNGILVTR